jgi:hypothetical protein
MLTDASNYVGTEFFVEVLVPGVQKTGEVQRHPEILRAAERIGQDSVVSLRTGF